LGFFGNCRKAVIAYQGPGFVSRYPSCPSCQAKLKLYRLRWWLGRRRAQRVRSEGTHNNVTQGSRNKVCPAFIPCPQRPRCANFNLMLLFASWEMSHIGCARHFEDLPLGQHAHQCDSTDDTHRPPPAQMRNETLYRVTPAPLPPESDGGDSPDKDESGTVKRTHTSQQIVGRLNQYCEPSGANPAVRPPTFSPERTNIGQVSALGNASVPFGFRCLAFPDRHQI